MKVLKKVKSVCLFVLGAAFFVFVLSMSMLLLNFNKFGLTEFDGTTLVIIPREIASDVYQKGDLVLVESKRVDQIKEQEDIFTYRVDSQGSVHIDLGKVGKIYPEEKAISFENGATYAEEFIAGVPTKVYSKVGSVLSVIESRWGFLFIVLVPCFLLFLYEVYELIVEVKYGSEEE